MPFKYYSILLLLVIAIQRCVISENSFGCDKKITEYGSVCVCNSTYCDDIPILNTFQSTEQYQIYTTSSNNMGFQARIGTFSDTQDIAEIEITVDAKVEVANGTKIMGFGGAFTDSAGFNIISLPTEAQDKLLVSYFGKNGIEYVLGRVPMGGADFSFRYYSYADEKDPTLSNFALQDEDLLYKINLIRRIKEIMPNEDDFKLMSSVWTAPPWMKSNNNWTSVGFLKHEYYQTWANYFVKFFEAYENEGIQFWGLTNQNEPSTGFLPPEDFEGFPSMAWFPNQLNDWIGTYLGPTIRGSKYNYLKIITHDDQRYLLPFLNVFILRNDTTLKYIDGVAVHYYADTITPTFWLNFTHTERKDLFILPSEACTGFQSKEGKGPPVALGSWDRAESYLLSIFEDLSYGAVGWMDWNLALDVNGGPLLINNNVDSPIIVNAAEGEFYKQPMFYALGHFSKFVIPGSTLIKTDLISIGENRTVECLGFLRPDNIVSLIIWNKEEKDLKVAVKNVVGTSSNTAEFTIESKSINTFLYSIM